MLKKLSEESDNVWCNGSDRWTSACTLSKQTRHETHQTMRIGCMTDNNKNKRMSEEVLYFFNLRAKALFLLLNIALTLNASSPSFSCPVYERRRSASGWHSCTRGIRWCRIACENRARYVVGKAWWSISESMSCAGSKDTGSGRGCTRFHDNSPGEY